VEQAFSQEIRGYVGYSILDNALEADGWLDFRIVVTSIRF
jgi:hypothetical protein